MAGVAVESLQLAGAASSPNGALRAVSDERGRYRLVGLPKGKGNEVLAVPNGPE